MNEPIYLDHAATTPVDPDVLAAMQPFFTEKWGNPTSIYSFAQIARSALDTARDEVAGVLNCEPMEVVFTSGGTESDNLALKGIAFARERRATPGTTTPSPSLITRRGGLPLAPSDYRGGGRGHIVTTQVEHHAVLLTAEYLERQGFDVTYLPVSKEGIVSVANVEKALRPDTILVSVMYANNEIGTIQPIAEIGKLCRERKIYFHTDAVQAGGVLSLDVKQLNVDMLSLSAHKFYGPKGAGCLYVRRGIQLVPQMIGGGQEHQVRSSTENVPAIVGMGKALVKAETMRESENERLKILSAHLTDRLLKEIPEVSLNGDRTRRLANNVNVLVHGLEGEPMLLRLDFEGIYASAGSACTSGSMEPSHVITALGIDKHDATGALRFTLGRETMKEQLDRTVEVLKKIVVDLRKMSAVG